MNSAQQVKALYERFGKTVGAWQEVRIFGRRLFWVPCEWLWIDEKPTHWNVTLANGKTSHQRLDGPALAVDICKDTGELSTKHGSDTGTWQTHLTMWPVSDSKRAAEIRQEVLGVIAQTYDHFASRPSG